MDKKILDFLAKHRLSSLTTLLKDGSPHASVLHYSHQENPLEIFFSCDNTSLKCEAILEGKSTKASVVIGFSEEEWVTFQMDGDIAMVSDVGELKVIQDRHYVKHPNSAAFKDIPTTFFLKFTPKWWRYTDYNTKPYTILSSEKS